MEFVVCLKAMDREEDEGTDRLVVWLEELRKITRNIL
jgi:hypothetical protein